MSDPRTEKLSKSNPSAEQRDIRLEQGYASDESIQQVHASLMRRKDEPRQGYPVMPMVIVLLFSAAILTGTLYMAARGGQFQAMIFDETLTPRDLREEADVEEAPPIEVVGERVYTQSCQACHQADGQGLPGAFPPLAETEWVTGSPERLVRVLLHGLVGEIEVRGETYAGIMPAFSDLSEGQIQRQLSDRDIAAVSTYIRQAWGNEASEITPEAVTEIREAAGSRAPWTAEELEPYVD